MSGIVDRILWAQTEYLESHMDDPQRVHLSEDDANDLAREFFETDRFGFPKWGDHIRPRPLPPGTPPWKAIRPGDRILGMEIVVNPNLVDSPVIEQASA